MESVIVGQAGPKLLENRWRTRFRAEQALARLGALCPSEHHKGVGGRESRALEDRKLSVRLVDCQCR